MTKRVLVTGAAGFIGHHVVEHLLRSTDWEVVGLVRLDRVGTMARLEDVTCLREPAMRARFSTVWHDLRSPVNRLTRWDLGEFDYVLHLAAETHVDLSIVDPRAFVDSNIVGTLNLMEWARGLDTLRAFLLFSTDEVYGPAAVGVAHRETDRYNATNPYAATKAGAEQLANAYANTYGLPVVITNTMNVFGERQDPEKFIPLVMRKVLAGEVVTIHADKSLTVSGSRHYIHARNVADAVLYTLNAAELSARRAEWFNVVGEREVSNLDLARAIADIMGKELHYEMVDFHSSRPGHDLRYALDGTKLRLLGWGPPVGFEQSLRRTVEWTLERRDKWLATP